MSAASERMRDKRAPAEPRRKAARISPELAEVLRMLKALENQPDADPADSNKSR